MSRMRQHPRRARLARRRASLRRPHRVRPAHAVQPARHARRARHALHALHARRPQRPHRARSAHDAQFAQHAPPALRRPLKQPPRRFGSARPRPYRDYRVRGRAPPPPWPTSRAHRRRRGLPDGSSRSPPLRRSCARRCRPHRCRLSCRSLPKRAAHRLPARISADRSLNSPSHGCAC